MATKFQMTEDQQARKTEYDRNGWPQIMTREDIELYMQRQWLTIQKFYGSRPDWPVRKVGEVWSVPLDDWRGFLSAFYTGRVYEGLADVQYGDKYTDD
ncbi:hypothetical protein [Weissella confusa]|uniref:hypothetical protein n=1 Tax=Weissella confusa TaxID=1583 RepID=UPI00107FBB45|nr:hypothetical protein [Weissella confusa]TGE80039.1 hypothetical protein C6P10_02435 [Weissella confusa]